MFFPLHVRIGPLVWRIPVVVDVQHRLKIDGGKPLFAWLDFRLLPSKSADGIGIATNWTDDTDNRWLPAICSAVDTFVATSAEAGRPVGQTTVEMVRVISHPVDTDDHSVKYNMMHALKSQFDLHAVECRT